MIRRRKQPTHPFLQADRGERLQKVLAKAGVASRRRCEELIAEGRVSVNGHMIDSLPAWVNAAEDQVVLDGKPLRKEEPKAYVMLFKPKGFVTTADDPEGRPNVLNLVEHPSRARLFPVGRLDMDSSGLLLLTNDGELANRLTHPRYEMHKGYEVTVKGRLEDTDVRRLEQGIFLPGKDAPGARAQASSLEILDRDREKTTLHMVLREGRNRQIRRMLLDLGHGVSKLRRTSMGPLELRGLALGEWRDLTSDEIGQLRRQAFADAATIFKRRATAERQARNRREGQGAASPRSSSGRRQDRSESEPRGAGRHSKRPYRHSRAGGAPAGTRRRST